MSKLALARGFVGNFIGDVHQEDDNKYKRSCDLRICDDSCEIIHFDSILSSATVINRKIVPRLVFLINIIIASVKSRLIKFGETIARINQAPDKLMDRADSALSQDFESIYRSVLVKTIFCQEGAVG